MNPQFQNATVTLEDQNTVVGHLTYYVDASDEYSQFEYDQSWLDNEVRFAISAELPLGSIKYKVESKCPTFHNCFNDMYPGRYVRDLINNTKFRKFATQFDTLTNTNDFVRQGAIRFLSNSEIPLYDSQVPNKSDLNILANISYKVDNNPQSCSTPEVKYLLNSVGSLGGMYPKANIEIEGNLWIAKFISQKYGITDLQIKAEIATMELAKLCGIFTSEFKLCYDNNNKPIALFKRFDRKKYKRIPYISAITALNKTNSTYTCLSNLIRKNKEYNKQDLLQLWKRIIFYILVSNSDDKLDNHGFIRTCEGLWRLSPIFDINPAAPYPTYTFVTHISDETGNGATIENALSVIDYFEIKNDCAHNIIDDISNKIYNNWKSKFNKYNISNRDIDIYEVAFNNEEMKKVL